MLKKLTVAAMIGAMSVASLPLMGSVASAQDSAAPAPPTAPDPSDAGAMSKDKMSSSKMSSGKMSKKSSMMSKKSMMMKKKKQKQPM